MTTDILTHDPAEYEPLDDGGGGAPLEGGVVVGKPFEFERRLLQPLRYHNLGAKSHHHQQNCNRERIG